MEVNSKLNIITILKKYEELDNFTFFVPEGELEVKVFIFNKDGTEYLHVLPKDIMLESFILNHKGEREYEQNTPGSCKLFPSKELWYPTNPKKAWDEWDKINTELWV